MSSALSPAAAPAGHENIRKVNSATPNPLDKNNNGSFGGPGETLDHGRKISEMITGQVNRANLQMGNKVNIFI